MYFILDYIINEAFTMIMYQIIANMFLYIYNNWRTYYLQHIVVSAKINQYVENISNSVEKADCSQNSSSAAKSCGDSSCLAGAQCCCFKTLVKRMIMREKQTLVKEACQVNKNWTWLDFFNAKLKHIQARLKICCYYIHIK